MNFRISVRPPRTNAPNVGPGNLPSQPFHDNQRSPYLVTTLERTLGFVEGDGDSRRTYLHRCIHLQLLSMGLPSASPTADAAVLEVAGGLLANYRQKSRL